MGIVSGCKLNACSESKQLQQILNCNPPVMYVPVDSKTIAIWNGYTWEAVLAAFLLLPTQTGMQTYVKACKAIKKIVLMLI